MISSIILDFEHNIDLVGKNSGKWKQISRGVGRKKARAKWLLLFITTFIRHVQNVSHRTGRTPEKKKKKIRTLHYKLQMFNLTGKSLSEALIFASNYPQYDNRLFIELPVHYM